MIVCAGESEQFDFAKPIGIGLVESAVNLTRLCEREKPGHIVFVGTAGSYGEKEIFEIVESRVAANVEQGFFEGNAYSPIDNVVASVAVQAVSGYRSIDSAHVSHETIVNSSNYITTNKKIWEHYIAHNIHIENMEFFAVMKVAQMFGISAEGIFIVTNYCDENAHDDFKKNHAEAMRRLTAYVDKRMKNA